MMNRLGFRDRPRLLVTANGGLYAPTWLRLPYLGAKLRERRPCETMFKLFDSDIISEVVVDCTVEFVNPSAAFFTPSSS